MLTAYQRKTGEWKSIKGKTYNGKDATTKGNAFKQEAVSHCENRGTYDWPNAFHHRTLLVTASFLQVFMGMIAP